MPDADFNDNPSDAALVMAMRSGQEHAVAQLYDRYSGVVYSIALRVLGETGAAEDILQDIFLQLWKNPGAFDAARGNLCSWLAVIARHRAIDVLRKRRPEIDISEISIATGQDLHSEAERTIVVQKIRGVLNSMPLPQRSALEMAYFQGLSHAEIAAKTQEPLGTIKTRIRSGLLALRKAVKG